MRLEQRADDVEHDTHAHSRDEQRTLTPEGVCEEEYEDGRSDDLDYSVDS